MSHTFPSYWRSVRARTLRVAEAIPAELITWSPGHGIMPFADILRHLALTERWMFVETALGRASSYRSHGPEFGQSKAEILALMQRLHADSLAMLDDMQTTQLQAQIETPAGARITCWKWLRAMVEHEVHHRGQLYMMLRLLDIATPPIFGLTSEELRSRAMSVTVRAASIDDGDAIIACLNAAFQPYRSQYTPEAFADTVVARAAMERRLQTMTVFVAEANADVVGTLCSEVATSGVGHLRGMAVLPAWQGQGVAIALLAAAERDLAARGCTRVTLDTTLPLGRAIAFYARNGYAPTSRMQDFFGMPLYEYAKEL